MKYSSIILLIFLSGMIAFSCTPAKKTIEKQEIKISKVETDSLHIKIVFNPFRWAIDKKNLYVYDPRQKPSLLVYDLNNNLQLYSYDIMGNGPDEFNFPGMCKLRNDQEIALYEERQNKFVAFSAADSLLKELYCYKFPETDNPTLYSRLFQLDESKYIGVSFTPKSVFCHLLDLKESIIMDELEISDKTEENASLYYSTFNYDNERLIVGFEFINAIQIYSIQNEKFQIEQTFGSEIKQGIKNVDTQNMHIYYTDVLSTENYYFALMQNCLEDNLYSQNSTLEVYNKNGDLIQLIDLERPISNILWSPEKNKIIGYSSVTEDSYLYTYKIDKL